MSLVRINPNPSRSQLAAFAVAWLAFFAFGGATAYRQGAESAAIVLAATAVVAPILGWISLRLLKLLYLALAYATFPIGFVFSLLLLAVVYYCVLTPTGILMRALGHDPLKRFDEARADSYWIPREVREGVDQSFRQY